jgi:acetyl-CoA carboxylase biotin carboxylase subunit
MNKTKFNKILIANRGEIALRIIRACKEMSIQTVQVFSEADRDSLPVKFADEAICIGGASPNQSYLNMSSIIGAATLLGVDALHPGYGFLSENATFASICQDYGIHFIGPAPDMLRSLKNKAHVRKIAHQAGVPILPGTLEPVENEEEAKKIADQITYPVLLKAAMGGGGRGIRKVNNQKDLEELFPIAKRESFASFGSDEIYIEKCLENPRHIEVQIFGDGKGNVVHLGIRECSIQRKHQKIIEEAPSLGLSSQRIQEMQEAACRLGKAINYKNAGTCEFLADDQDKFYLLEINARIQVEHPISEETTGIDIVKTQIMIAEANELPFHQSDIAQKGWAFEFRITAEDPYTYTPSSGTLSFLHFPSGRNVRVDSHVYNGYTIPSHYDSMIAKLIVFEKDRNSCLALANRCLEECTIEGIKTNIPLLQELIRDKDFISGKIHTGFIQQWIDRKNKTNT